MADVEPASGRVITLRTAERAALGRAEAVP